MTAYAAARDAGFTPGHVRLFERGMRVPSPKSLQRLAAVLKLTPAERSRLFKFANDSVRPTDVADAAPILAVPGLSVWKHLPGLLWSVDHEFLDFAPADPDRRVADCVAAAASALAYRLLLRNGLLKRDVASFATVVEAEQSRPLPKPWDRVREIWGSAALIASAVAPGWWKARVFEKEKGALAAIRDLSWWKYTSGVHSSALGLLSFRFPDAPVENVSAPVISGMFDSLIVDLVWDQVDGRSRYSADPNFESAGFDAVRDAIRSAEVFDKRRGDMSALLRNTEAEPISELLIFLANLQPAAEASFVARFAPSRDRIARAAFGDDPAQMESFVSAAVERWKSLSLAAVPGAPPIGSPVTPPLAMDTNVKRDTTHTSHATGPVDPPSGAALPRLGMTADRRPTAIQIQFGPCSNAAAKRRPDEIRSIRQIGFGADILSRPHANDVSGARAPHWRYAGGGAGSHFLSDKAPLLARYPVNSGLIDRPQDAQNAVFGRMQNHSAYPFSPKNPSGTLRTPFFCFLAHLFCPASAG